MKIRIFQILFLMLVLTYANAQDGGKSFDTIKVKSLIIDNLVVRENNTQIKYTQTIIADKDNIIGFPPVPLKVKYGTNLMLEINNVNVFLSTSKSYAEYKPINYDFSTKDFLDKLIELEKEKLGESEFINSSNHLKINQSINEFSEKFKAFQNTFRAINDLTNLYSQLNDFIKSQPLFINSTKFKEQAKEIKSKLIGNGKNDVNEKMNDIYKLYFELQESFKIINQNQEKKTYVFSGDLKDGKNTLKVSGLKAEIVSKLIFEEEMKQVKAIYDPLILPNNRNLPFCSYSNICNYLSGSNEDRPRTINNNLSNCSNETLVFENCTLGLVDIYANFIKFYPNPTTAQINFTQDIFNLEISDTIGKKVKSFVTANTLFDVSELSKGVYLIKGLTAEGLQVNQKLIKE